MAILEIPTRTDGVRVSEDDADLLSNEWSLVVKKKYAARKVLGRVVYLHRLIADRMNLKGVRVDHINGDSLDNRRSNLRAATHQQNAFNQQKQKRSTSSKFKGVTFDKSRNKWMAAIKHDGVRHYLGRFTRESDAAKAYDAAAIVKFGEFALTNQDIYGDS
jgi:hypothetical protein